MSTHPNATAVTGDIVTVARGWNSNKVERTDVRVRVLAWRGWIMIGEAVDDPFRGEGIWTDETGPVGAVPMREPQR